MTAIMWARFMHLYAREFGIITGPIPIAGDNEKTMALYEDPFNPARNVKCHSTLRFNCAREQVQRMEAIPVFVFGKINLSDLMTTSRSSATPGASFSRSSQARWQ